MTKAKEDKALTKLETLQLEVDKIAEVLSNTQFQSKEWDRVDYDLHFALKLLSQEKHKDL